MKQIPLTKCPADSSAMLSSSENLPSASQLKLMYNYIAPAEGVSRFHPKTKTNSEDEFHTYLFRRRITTRRRFTSRKQRRRRLPRRRVTPRRRITSRRRIPKTHSTKTSCPAKTNHLPKTHSEDTFHEDELPREDESPPEDAFRRHIPRRRVTPRRRITSRRRIPKTHSTKTNAEAERSSIFLKLRTSMEREDFKRKRRAKRKRV